MIKKMSDVASLRKRLHRQDWIDTTFDLLVEAGIGAVSIDRLAGILDVTRGSFYHHFSGRDELMMAVLEYWAERWTYRVRDEVMALGLDPSTTLLALMRAIRNTGASRYDAAIRAWALHDPAARDVVKVVDETRLQSIKKPFEALGFTGIDAENRARLFLHYEMAAPAMFAQMTTEDDERLLIERHRFLTTAKVD